MDEHREGGLMAEAPGLTTGESIPELRITPDRYLPHRYAGASGDFNPIHLDPELAKQVGLPGNILHGLWGMAQVARASVDAAGGDPSALRRLAVEFRGLAFPEQEVTVTGTVRELAEDHAVIDVEVAQGGNGIIRNAEAEITL
jgi:acyl dehydratase